MKGVGMFLAAGLAGGMIVPALAQSHEKRMQSLASKHEFAEVNGVRLHYVTAGKGNLILFVHGFPEFWYAWKNQLVEFGKDYQAVAIWA